MNRVPDVHRQDLRLDNEATGWVLTSAGLNGKPAKAFAKQGGRQWNEAVADGTLIPIELVQDDGFDVRVIVNDALSADEEAEWIDRLTWKLSIPDGRLVIAGGADYLCGDRDERDQVTVDVVPGDYRVDVYTHLYSINGAACLAKAGVRESGLKRYYLQTRPDQPMPLRVQRWLDLETEHDKLRAAMKKRIEDAAETSWRYLPRPEDQVPEREEPDEAVQFVVRLTPLADHPVEAMPKIKRGWFSAVQSPRRPERFPLGLTSTVATAARPAPPTVAPPLIPARVFGMPLAPINGGPVELPLPEGLGLVCWLALFCHREASPQIRVRNADGFPAARLACRDDLFVQIDEPGGFTVHCLLWQTNAIRRVHLLASMLRDLPDGAVLEFATGAAGGEKLPEGDAHEPASPGPGMHRYHGRVAGGRWRLESSWPATDAQTLRRALEIADDIDLCRPVALPDEASAHAVIASMSENGIDYRTRKRSGDPLPEAHGASIRLAPNLWYQSFEVGAFTLRQLFPDAWPYKVLEDKPLWPFG